MTTHTPGPWTWDGAQVCTKTEGVIAECGLASTREPNDFLKYEECAANARLIAAAPDMLAMLKSAALWIEATAEMTGDAEAAKYLTKLQAAIAKAEGEKS